MVRLALYQPDIPQNTGTLLRLAACFAVSVDIIEPCGFVLDDRRMRRAGMDYLEAVTLVRHSSWEAFMRTRKLRAQAGDEGRLLLLSTRAETHYTDYAFRSDDTLLLGRESAGVPDDVFASTESQLRIPVVPGLRSLNVALAAAIVLGEALRQVGSFPTKG